MTYEEVITELSNLKEQGKLQKQTVEVISASKKYFIHHIDVSSDKVMLKVDRSHYTPLVHSEFFEKLDEVRDLVNTNARLYIVELEKTEGPEVSKIFCSGNFVELISE